MARSAGSHVPPDAGWTGISPLLEASADVMTDHRSVRVTIPGRAYSVRAALRSVLARLSESGVSADDRSTLELVLAEVLNNVVEHAYANCLDGTIELSIRREINVLVCEVVDAGRPMPGTAMPPGRLSPTGGNVDSLPEGGFGWFLIRELAEDLCYRRDRGCNRLRFSLPLRKTGAAALGRRAV